MRFLRLIAKTIGVPRGLGTPYGRSESQYDCGTRDSDAGFDLRR